MDKITTTDGFEVAIGDRVVAYYATPVQWGTIATIDTDGWCDVELDDGTKTYADGERLAAWAPTSGPCAIGDDPRAPFNGPMRGESRFHEYDGN